MASLNPARWGRQGSHSFTKDSSATANSLSKSPSNSNLIAAGNREKARQWIRDQAILFITKYSETELVGNGRHTSSTVLSRLSSKFDCCLFKWGIFLMLIFVVVVVAVSGVIQNLDGNFENCISALRELRDILIESDISPFEVNHSGLIKSMLSFMASEHGIVHRDDRLRAFLHTFAGLPLDSR